MDSSALRLRLPADSRAQELLSALDTRYFSFMDRLSPALQEIGLAESTYIGEEASGLFRGVKSFNPLITCTPWLFWELFSGLDGEDFVNISEAGLCLALASVVMDHLVDEQVGGPGLMLLFHQALYEHGISRYREIFPFPSSFWAQFDRLSREYTTSLGEEVGAQSNPSGFDFDTFARSASGKVSPMAITIAALAEATGEPELLGPIEKSMRHSYLAGQIHDDILDWRSDLQERHITYFLTCLAPPNAFKGDEWSSKGAFELINSKEWMDVNKFRLVLEWFNRAIEAVQGIECPGWLDYLQEYRRVAEQHQKAALARHLLKVVKQLKDSS